ncbi:hypothetical protein GCM10022378_02630 [Salinicoccus jeotgali]|uniref:Lipoprotein n=1 Tax=Salinicoccus jeotgali TaxID=381634 RepID=A0ABP7E8N2_9STAP
MKFIIVLLAIPLFIPSCVGLFIPDDSNQSATEDTGESASEESTEETTEVASEKEPTEVTPIDVTRDAFVSNLFSANYEYRTISLRSSYEYMTRILGEPVGNGQSIDGVYYHYDHIAFNFPEKREGADDLSELKINGIIIFPENLTKQEAVETFGWPTRDEVSDFWMIYDADDSNEQYVMLKYDQEDKITEIILQHKNLEDTGFYGS